MMSKANEPVKLVYPNQQQQQQQQQQAQQPGASTGAGQQQQHHNHNNHQSAVINMNNRVTFTSQTLPNGTISLTSPQHQQQQQQQPLMQPHQQTSSAGITVVSAGGSAVMKSGGQPQQQQQQQQHQHNHHHPSHIVIHKQGNPNQSLIPSVQILNMRPGAPVNQQVQQQQQQKTVAAVSPRVVTHMVGPRAPNSSGPQQQQQQQQQQQPQPQQQITLTTLQNLQQSGGGQPGAGGQQQQQQQQQAILLKTESGQFQLLRVGPSPGGGPATSITSANQTIRLQTVPAQSIASSSAQSVVVNSAGHSQTIQHIQASQQPPQQQQQQQQQQPPPPVASIAPVVAVASQAQNTKEKCRKFLANLLELSSREPRPVEQNVRTLIQELIDASVEPEVFCERLEKLLNASPQPCLIGFLKKSLPLLRQSLVTKELVIDGIIPPSHNVAFGGTISANIPAHVRPVGQSPMRMVGQAQPRPIGHTTITRHTAPVRIQGPSPRLVRPGAPAIVQQTNHIHHQPNPPALQPVGSYAPGGAQIRPPRTPAGLQIRQTVSKPPPPHQQLPPPMQQLQSSPSTANNHHHTAKSAITKVGSTQIKPISASTNGPTASTLASPVAISTFPYAAAAVPPLAQTTAVVVAPAPSGASTTTTVATPPPPPSTSTATTTTSSTATPTTKSSTKSAAASSATTTTTTTTTISAKAAAAAAKEKEKKSTTAAVAASAFYPQSAALSMAGSMYGDDDINDVAAMGGVNLAEESQQILGSTELIGTQIRSCKDEVLLHMPALQARIRQMMARHGLEEPSTDVAVLISHAAQERLKNVVEKLAVIAEHRIDIIKVDPRYEVTKDVRGQIKFLEELDKAEQKRHEEQEREMLMRAAKSRSKTEDPEQVKLKAKAKEMQRAEMEELRQRDANLTALQAIGPRKKAKLENEMTTTSETGGTGASTMGGPPTPLRPRIKRVNLKDMVFYMEQERETCRSSMLYKAYLK